LRSRRTPVIEGGERIMYVVSVKIESHVIELLDSYAKKHGLNRSVIIRRAIEKFLQEKSKQKPNFEDRLQINIKILSFKVESDLLRRLDMYAINSKRNRSEVIRAAIMELLKEEEDRVTVPTAKVEKSL
jgi:metal-responsive CopG/Arc/MetJ family transcriptional regulator